MSTLRLVREPRKTEPLLPSAVLGTLFFIIAEAMLFAGFISGYIVVEANYPPGMWPPPDQPRLPIEVTAMTTAMLLGSGVVLWWAGRRFSQSAESARGPMALAVLMGAVFVGVQGVEWAQLIGEGLTLTSSSFGGFFYVIVGAHALHAIPAICILFLQRRKLLRGKLEAGPFAAARLFWYFVVLVWPVLYWTVYL
jgi:heme/copper-type cytochrome/quinol oxidase subunit 3